LADVPTRALGLKTRGSIASQIERTDRLDRLALVLALALSTGLWDAIENRTPVEKKPWRRTQECRP
jgi:hypothetical protein